jgi:hypothetical protein
VPLPKRLRVLFLPRGATQYPNKRDHLNPDWATIPTLPHLSPTAHWQLTDRPPRYRLIVWHVPGCALRRGESKSGRHQGEIVSCSRDNNYLELSCTYEARTDPSDRIRGPHAHTQLSTRSYHQAGATSITTTFEPCDPAGLITLHDGPRLQRLPQCQAHLWLQELQDSPCRP